MISQSVNSVVELHRLSVSCGIVMWSTSLVHRLSIIIKLPGYKGGEAQVVQFRLELYIILCISCICVCMCVCV